MRNFWKNSPSTAKKFMEKPIRKRKLIWNSWKIPGGTANNLMMPVRVLISSTIGAPTKALESAVKRERSHGRMWLSLHVGRAQTSNSIGLSSAIANWFLV